MTVIRFSLFLVIPCLCLACLQPAAQLSNVPTKPVMVADSFAYPIGEKEVVTQSRDADEWYNALDFGANDHLGEDWNKNSGEPVYAAANGVVTYAQDAGPGWGNVVIIEHTLPSGEKVESLYAHMQEIFKPGGEVKKRELIGKIGNANGRYLCHLHFEIRTSFCPKLNQAGDGYAPEKKGWVDPSDFIDGQRRNHDR